MKKKLFATTLCMALAGTASHAIADEVFAGVTLGQSTNNIHKSRALNAQQGNPNLDRVIRHNSTWGARVGQRTGQMRYYLGYDQVSSEYRAYKLQHQNLLASADALIPVGTYETALFAGVSGGLVRLSQDSRGFRSHSDNGWAAGVQAGVLQNIGEKVSLEVGYRYLRTTADARLQPRGDASVGRISLRSSSQAYLGANYRF